MSDETPETDVEFTLLDLMNAPREDGPLTESERHAIDCGREAIRLLRDMDRDEVNPTDWDVYRRILLARCTEGR